MSAWHGDEAFDVYWSTYTHHLQSKYTFGVLVVASRETLHSV